MVATSCLGLGSGTSSDKAREAREADNLFLINEYESQDFRSR